MTRGRSMRVDEYLIDVIAWPDSIVRGLRAHNLVNQRNAWHTASCITHFGIANAFNTQTPADCEPPTILSLFNSSFAS